MAGVNGNEVENFISKSIGGAGGLRRTTGRRAPQIKMREKDNMSPTFAAMFSCSGNHGSPYEGLEGGWRKLSWWNEPGCRLRSSPRSPPRAEGTPHFFVQESTDTEAVRSTIEKDESTGV